MNKFVEIIKDIWNSKRKRSFIGLIACIVFMVIAVNIVRPSEEYYRNYSTNSNVSSNSSNIATSNVLENYKNMSSYEMNTTIDVTINNKKTTYNMESTYFNDKYYIQINNVSYYINGDNIYQVNNIDKTLILVDQNNLLNKINIKLILKDDTYNLMSYSSVTSKKSYKDGTSTVEYIYNDYQNKSITIVTNGNNTYISDIKYDFTNYYDKKIYQAINITSEYKNINNIADYDKNYDEYKIINDISTSNITSNITSNSTVNNTSNVNSNSTTNNTSNNTQVTSNIK